MTERAKLTNRPYRLLIGILLIAIMGGVGWKLQSFVNPQRQATAKLNTACDLQSGPCSTSFSDGIQVSLSITPRPIPVLKQLKLTSEIQGIEANAVEIDIVGVGMNMGYNRPELAASGKANQFQGESILPICLMDTMQWEARVMVHTDKGLMVAPFRFETQKTSE